jgi:RimJ/RimL family protein N-acetyltransferase
VTESSAVAVGPAGYRRLPAELVLDTVVLRTPDESFADEFAAGIAASLPDMRFVWQARAVADPLVAADSLRRSALRQAAEEPDELIRHVFEVGSGRWVARLNLHSWDPEVPRCELGYMANSQLTGRGLVTTAARRMVDFAWELGAFRVQAICDVRNAPAIRFAERLGMAREGLLRHYERDDVGELCDQVILAMLRPVG